MRNAFLESKFNLWYKMIS